MCSASFGGVGTRPSRYTYSLCMGEHMTNADREALTDLLLEFMLAKGGFEKTSGGFRLTEQGQTYLSEWDDRYHVEFHRWAADKLGVSNVAT